MDVHFTQMSKRVAVSPGDLLFAEALLCSISVAKVNCVQDVVATSHVRREKVFLWLPTCLFGKYVLFVSFGKMILPQPNSSHL